MSDPKMEIKHHGLTWVLGPLYNKLFCPECKERLSSGAYYELDDMKDDDVIIGKRVSYICVKCDCMFEYSRKLDEDEK